MTSLVSGVYAFKHVASGRYYVGSSVNVSARRRSHLSQLRRGVHKCIKLLRAFEKYGEAAFSFELLETAPPDEAPLRAAEQAWMDKLSAVTEGFNVAPFAGNAGRTPKSPEHRRRIGDARRGQKHSDESRALISARATGRSRGPATEATKARIGEANRGRKWTAEQKAALSRSVKGKKRGPMSDATRAALSAAKTGKAQSEHHKQRVREGKAAKKALTCR